MSGMSTSLSGVQNAAQSMGVTASRIASPRNPEQLRTLQEPPAPEGENPEGAALESHADLAEQAMKLKSDRVTYEANLQFLQVQGSLLGTSLDMKA